MNRTWWENILNAYPQSLESCKSYFQNRYRDQWRERIQDYLSLIEFFQDNGIRIYVHWKHHQSGKKYGYKITNRYIKIQMDYIFDCQQKAGVHALEFAFKILEWSIIQMKQKSTFSGFVKRENRKTK